MGLDFEGSEAHWSYLGFHAFRSRLAAEIGITLSSMRGFGGRLDWGGIQDPLVVLLNHSDSDGEISARDCARLAPRLREIVARWENGYDKQNAEMLADSMDRCSRLGVPLVFC